VAGAGGTARVSGEALDSTLMQKHMAKSKISPAVLPRAQAPSIEMGVVQKGMYRYSRGRQGEAVEEITST